MKNSIFFVLVSLVYSQSGFAQVQAVSIPIPAGAFAYTVDCVDVGTASDGTKNEYNSHSTSYELFKQKDGNKTYKQVISISAEGVYTLKASTIETLDGGSESITSNYTSWSTKEGSWKRTLSSYSSVEKTENAKTNSVQTFVNPDGSVETFTYEYVTQEMNSGMRIEMGTLISGTNVQPGTTDRSICTYSKL